MAGGWSFSKISSFLFYFAPKIKAWKIRMNICSAMRSQSGKALKALLN